MITESVTHMHPDKICDQVSDALLDAYLKEDTNARVTIEAVGGHAGTLLFLVRCDQHIRYTMKEL